MLTKESLELIKEIKQNIKISDLLVQKSLKDLFNYLQDHKYSYSSYSKKPIRTGKFPSSIFLTDSLYDKIKPYNRKQLISWKVTGQSTVHCSLNIYSKSKKKFPESTINLLVEAISFILSFAKNDKKLKIHLLLLPDKKLFNGNFTVNEINSGSASYNSKEGTIHIWRLEECIKVIIHECIHFIEFSDIRDTKLSIKHFNTRYNTSSQKMNFNETYTELWARLLNCYFLSYLYKINNSNIKQYEYFCYLIAVEREFSNLQSSKIKKHLAREFKKNKSKIDINKQTSVLAYYVLTSHVLNNLDQFLKQREKKNYFYLENDTQFLQFLKRCTELPTKLTHINKNYYKTFRMTVAELKILPD